MGDLDENGNLIPPPEEVQPEVQKEVQSEHGDDSDMPGIDDLVKEGHSNLPGSSSEAPSTQTDHQLSSIFKGLNGTRKRKQPAESVDQELTTERIKTMKAIQDNLNPGKSKQQQENDEWTIIGQLVSARLRNCTSSDVREDVLERMVFPALAALKRD